MVLDYLVRFFNFFFVKYVFSLMYNYFIFLFEKYFKLGIFKVFFEFLIKCMIFKYVKKGCFYILNISLLK